MSSVEEEMRGREALLPQPSIGGQHFLIDPGVAERTADIGRIGCEIRRGGCDAHFGYTL